MITAVAWVPRGAPRADPKRPEPSAEELEAIAATAAEGDGNASDEGNSVSDDTSSMSEDGDAQDDDGDGVAHVAPTDPSISRTRGSAASTSRQDTVRDAKAAAQQARAAASALAGGKRDNGSVEGSRDPNLDLPADSIEAAMRELDMDNYDSDDDDAGRVGASILSRALNGKLDIHKGDDPYLHLSDSVDEKSEAEDLRILPSDLVMIAARSEDDLHNLEVWVYEEAQEQGGEANVYVHHEVLLPNFPLAIAWLDVDPRTAASDAAAQGSGNFVAVGTLDPGIEIWDLDTIDAVEPVVTLGGVDKDAERAAVTAAESDGKLDKKKRKKLKEKLKKRGPHLLPGSHVGGVLSLSWNQVFRNVLASAGEDTTVKVWDIVRGTAEFTLTHHTDKVQAVAWNPSEPSVLLTGSFDKTASLADVRASTAAAVTWRLPADCEALCWTPHSPTCFLVSCENGMTLNYDARKGAGSSPLWQLAAHDKPTCALSWCPGNGGAGLLATGSTDKLVKLWNVRENSPSLITSQDLQVGAIFTLGFCPSAPHLLAVGGAAGSASVWDVRAAAGVSSHFPSLL